MGQKVHPYGFRLGIIRQSRGRWFAAGRRYRNWLIEDLKLRRFLRLAHRNAAISDVVIDRTADSVTVTIVTAKPGVIIGRGGRDVDALRQRLEKEMGKRTRVNVEEARDPDLNAQLVASGIATQLERRVSHRWAMRQAMERAMRMGAKGCRIAVSGRLGGVEIARSEGLGPRGRVPLSTLRADIDYGQDVAHTSYGPIGVKVWVYRGEVLPAKRVKLEEEEAEAELVAEIAEAQRQLHGEDEKKGDGGAAAPAEAPAPAPAAPVEAAQAAAAEEAGEAAEAAKPEEEGAGPEGAKAEQGESATVAPAPQPITLEEPAAEEPLSSQLMEAEEPLAAAIDAEDAAASEEKAGSDEEADEDVNA